MKLGFGFLLFLFLVSTKACDEEDCRTSVAVGSAVLGVGSAVAGVLSVLAAPFTLGASLAIGAAAIGGLAAVGGGSSELCRLCSDEENHDDFNSAEDKFNEIAKGLTKLHDIATDLKGLSELQVKAHLQNKRWFKQLESNQQDLLLGQANLFRNQDTIVSNQVLIQEQLLFSQVQSLAWFKKLTNSQKNILVGQTVIKGQQKKMSELLNSLIDATQRIEEEINISHILTLYGSDISNINTIITRFQQLNKDESGRLLPGRRTDNFIAAALTYPDDLQTASERVVKMLTKGHPLKPESVWESIPSMCNSTVKELFSNLLIVSEVLRGVALYLEGDVVTEREIDSFKTSLIQIESVYIKDCGCTSGKLIYQRENLDKLVSQKAEDTEPKADFLIQLINKRLLPNENEKLIAIYDVQPYHSSKLQDMIPLVAKTAFDDINIIRNLSVYNSLKDLSLFDHTYSCSVSQPAGPQEILQVVSSGESGVKRDDCMGLFFLVPEILQVASSGESGVKHGGGMGLFFLVEGASHNGHPVWEMDRKQYKLFYTKGGSWCIGTPEDENGGICTAKTGLVLPPVSGWKYTAVGGKWIPDQHLTVQAGPPAFPTKIGVSSTGPAKDEHPRTMGEYVKTTQLSHSKPVYRNQEDDEVFLLYLGIGYWLIGSNTTSVPEGLIKSKYRGKILPPQQDWQYSDGTGTWPVDDSLVFTVID